MKTPRILIGAFVLLFLGTNASVGQRLSAKLKGQIEKISTTFEQLEETRKTELDQTAWTLTKEYRQNNRVDVVLIDKENADIGQIALAWLQASAYYFNLDGFNVTCGGTDPGSINGQALSALGRMGFKIRGSKNEEGFYTVKYGSGIWTFSSKSYKDTKNPQTDFVAILMDAQSVEKLKDMRGAILEIPLAFDTVEAIPVDPSLTYDLLNQKIAAQMVYLGYKLKSNLAE